MDFKEHFRSACLSKAKELGRKLVWSEVWSLACLSHEACLPVAPQLPVKAQKSPKLAGDEGWIAELEKEPSLAGIDVKKQLGMAQFWCRNNNRVCTRKFFQGWLQRADRTITLNADGKSSKVTVVANIYQEPEHWELMAAKVYGADIAHRMFENGWGNVSPDMRSRIIREAK